MRPIPLVGVTLILAVSACAPTSGPTTASAGATSKEKASPQREVRTKPCHPGCFPAGTLVETPDGPRAIETIGRGDVVTLVGPDGAQARGKVQAIFQTCNSLVEIRTGSGSLITTGSRPGRLLGPRP